MNSDFHSLFIKPETLLMEAMGVIEKGSAQIALVVDARQCLLGTLTDGDIRRGLLHGATLETPVKQLMNRQFRSVSCNEDKLAVLEMMKQELLLQVPVLDQFGRVLNLLLLQELLSPSHLSNAVVIMAGGEGKRLRPHTEECPKPMLPVDGKPMLEILLEQCITSGFRQFYFSVNYLKEQIVEHFLDGSRWGVQINYLVEQEPLGTAGSLQLLPGSVADPFLVMNGDLLTRLNLCKLFQFHSEQHAQATLCVTEHVLTVPFGVVQTNGVELASFEEKPSYRQLVNAGIYIIDPVLLPLLPSQQFTDMPTLLLAAQEKGLLVAVCPIHEYWLDVGRPESLQQAHQEWPIQAKS